MPTEGVIMKKKLYFGILFIPFFLALASNQLFSRTVSSVTAPDTLSNVRLDSVIVVASRSGRHEASAHSRIDREQMAKTAPNQNLPFALSLSPAVVAIGENGTGSGYAHLRIRGSEGSRINVSLNGVSINDAESQEVFWVNLPAIGSMLQNIQIQRGTGSPTGGTANFGASVNMQTLYTCTEAYAEAKFSYGSYDSFTGSCSMGTGLGSRYLPRGFSADLSLTRSYTRGYIRNGKGNLSSVFARMVYSAPKTVVKLQYIYGEQHTGITWEGISREALETDRRSNPAGAYRDAAGNIRYYDNETDNYMQHHIQLLHSREIGSSLTWSNILHYTRGDGYYENYETDKKLSYYGISNPSNPRSDAIARQMMGNDYAAAHTVLAFKDKIFAGLNYAYYSGRHFGRLLWAMYAPVPEDRREWYSNTGTKQEAGAFLKIQEDLGDFTVSAHLQYRYVDYRIQGPDKDRTSLDYGKSHSFTNPMLGLNYRPAKGHEIYARVSVSHREASRSDVKENIKARKTGDLKAERLLDCETGYRFKASQDLQFGINLYAMEYKNQLVPTGKLSDTGYEIKENVPRSYRRGIETELDWQICRPVNLKANFCLSSNKIKDFTLWLDTYDNPEDWNPVSQKCEYYETTDLIYSPSFTALCALNFKPCKGLSLNLIAHAVGKQYYDNSSSGKRSLPAYWVCNFTATQKIYRENLVLHAYVNNLFNRMYTANAWAYRAAFADGSDDYVEEGFYPQAGINFMIQLCLKF